MLAGNFSLRSGAALDFTTIPNGTITTFQNGSVTLFGNATWPDLAVNFGPRPLRLMQEIESVNFTNKGSFALLNGAQISTTGDWINHGELQVDSTSTLICRSLGQDGQALIDGEVFGQITVVEGAVFEGAGVVRGDLINRGIIAPGNSIGQLVIEGDYIATANAQYLVEISGATEHDQLVVAGLAKLAGQVRVRFLENESGTETFIPTAGTYLDVLTAARIEGKDLSIAVNPVDGSMIQMAAALIPKDDQQVLRLTVTSVDSIFLDNDQDQMDDAWEGTQRPCGIRPLDRITWGYPSDESFCFPD